MAVMRGPPIVSMAWRNLWRQRRRTLLTLSSIAFGTSLAWVFTAFGDGNWRQMIDLAARMGGGHVTIQHLEYADRPALSRSIRGVTGLETVALEDPLVARVVSRISGNLMISSAARTYGAGFIAFDPALEDATTLSILDAVSEGSLFEREGKGGILIGARLAENLRVDVGRRVVYTVTDKNGEIVQGAVRVSGIVRTGSPGIDAGLVLLPISYLRDGLGYETDEAVQVAVFLADQRDADEVADRLSSDLADVAVLPWHEMQPELAGFITMKVVGAQFMEIIIMLLVAAGIFNTLFVSVMERMREFGILRAIGWTPTQLFGLVMTESAQLALVGLALAACVSAWPIFYLTTTGVDLMSATGVSGSEIAGVAMPTLMKAHVYPETALLIAAFSVGATLLSGVYPAWKAGRVDPVETVRLQ